MRLLHILAAVFVVCSIQALAAHTDLSDEKFKPAVAFFCEDKMMPAMHRVVNQWEADHDTRCLEDLEDVLDYCKKMYPDRDIRNVIEASKKVDINNWPQGQLKTTHRVRPFECIGEFESQALLVPQHCIFDHEHDNKKCERPGNWTATAAHHCMDRGMALESSGMLVICGTDAFRGVEYVCCPKMESGDSQTEESSEGDSAEAEEDDYLAYLKGDDAFLNKKYKNEHEKFKAAYRALKKHQHEKITKMMKQWQAAREHVSEMRKTDYQRAEQLNKDITEKFQRMYHAYEQEGTAEKKQLVALHQQHVQAILNQMKRVNMEAYMNELSADEPSVSRVLHFLKLYIRVEEKDKLHCVNHFEHLRDSDAEEAISVRESTLEHIRMINSRIDEAIKMLDRNPDLATELKPQIKEFREKKFRNIELSSDEVVLRPVQTEGEKEHKTINVALDIDSSESDDYTFGQGSEHKNIQIDSEMALDQEDNQSPYVANIQNNKASLQHNVPGEKLAAGAGTGNIIGIAIGSLAVFIIIVVAVVMLRKRSQRQPITHGFVEVDPAASPEERHVANMQMNGYENPTYRYFEMGTQ